MAWQKLAYGVERSCSSYRLKLARYPALAETVAQYVQQRPATPGRRGVDLLDVGSGYGRSMRYIRSQVEPEDVRFHGVDLFPGGQHRVYQHQDWKLYEHSLEEGLPMFDSDRFDVVICEQVLEHLHNAQFVASELVRVLRPDGILIAGVPIFPGGVHLLRRHAVPVLDRVIKPRRPRNHVQAFSMRSFLKMLDEAGPLEINDVRGFRIVSGGLLRPLEDFRWWWRLNRYIGVKAPSLCIETQVVATKLRASLAMPSGTPRQPVRKAA
ncbi:MAG: methyltransferase domain-containing protein [Candidatus Nealsonbacteria bacterium]|nr:methyltransferase domain-containing protein [Candidatus Nealsonbacteria bacterium]